MANDIELQDSTQPDDLDEVEEVVEEESEEESQEESTEEESDLVEKNKQLFERTKKAEADAKKLKQELSKYQGEVHKPDTEQFLTREEAFLLKGDLDVEDLDYLKVIQSGLKAQGEDKSLAKLQDHTLFKAYLKEKKEAAKKAKAKLGASSKSVQIRESIKPDMSREEHRELWRKATGN